MDENRYAILIASSSFQDQNLQNLRCPENDVDGLNEILKSREYGNFSETWPLKNSVSYDILNTINQVFKKAHQNDLVLIYFSGHGKLDRAGRLHLATTNTIVDLMETTSIPIESLKNLVDVANTNRTILILDCCFSGAAGVAFSQTRSSVNDQLQLLSGGRGIYIMTSSTSVQISIERESEKYGAFTKHIIEGIRDWRAANEHGYVTIDGLYSYVHKQMIAEGFQKPMKWGLNVEGDLVIAIRGNTFHAQGKYDEVIKACNKAVGIDTPDVETWNNKGIALYGQGKYDEAIKAYDRAIEINPNYAEACITKAILLALRTSTRRPLRLLTRP